MQAEQTHSLDYLGYHIPLSSLSKREANNIESELTVSPFDSFRGRESHNKIKLFRKTDKEYILPKYWALNYFKNSKVERRYCHYKMKDSVTFIGDLNDMQICSFNKFMKERNGTISIPCGKGKTVVAIAIACAIRVKTLIVVHADFLEEQWRKRIKDFAPNASVGLIRQKIIDVYQKDFVIGYIDSIASSSKYGDVFRAFGLVIYDECHHSGSTHFSKSLLCTSASYTMGLSATPRREDGLMRVIYWFLGDLAVEIKEEKNELVQVKTVACNIETVVDIPLLKLSFGKEQVNYSKLINMVSENKERCRFVADTIIDVVKDKRRKLLVLSCRLDLLENLKLLLDEGKVENVCWYVGKTKRVDRQHAEESGDVILTTYQLAREALDIKKLNTLVMITPAKEIEQAVGRILRGFEFNTPPMIVDIVDFTIPILKHQYFSRLNFYKSRGFTLLRSSVQKEEIETKKEEIIETPFLTKKNKEKNIVML